MGAIEPTSSLLWHWLGCGPHGYEGTQVINFSKTQGWFNMYILWANHLKGRKKMVADRQIAKASTVAKSNELRWDAR